MPGTLRVLRALVCTIVVASPLALATQDEAAPREPAPGAPRAQGAPLTVAIKAAPPFVIPDDSAPRGYRGVSVALWDGIAGRLGLEYTFVERGLPELLSEVAAGEADAGVGAITINAEREQSLDFTHAYFNSGLGIAARAEGGSAWLGAARRLLSIEFLLAICALGAVLLAAGLLVWIFERKRNREQFGAGARGIGAGFWWSAVTMTTVGYGDKAPVTPLGRAVALVWMFTSIIIISSFTAAIASALTVSGLDTGVRGPGDLPGTLVGAVEGATSEDYLRRQGARVRTYENVPAALRALAAGDLQAVVHDRPILQYEAGRMPDAPLRILPDLFELQDYALVLPPQSDQREAVNLALLEVISTDDWTAIVERYAGK